MLRNLVLLLAGALCVVGAAATAFAWPAGLAWLAWGLILLIGTVFERVRYKRLAAAAPEPRFRRTDERFFDPGTGEPVTVYADPATGERSYVRE